MATYQVTDDLIRSQQAADYFSNTDRRIVMGLRAALEMLNIPVPEYALRKPCGRPPAGKIAAAYEVDNPAFRHLQYRPRSG